MDERFDLNGEEEDYLDGVLQSLSKIDLGKLVERNLRQHGFNFDVTEQTDSLVFRLIQRARSQNWLADLILMLDKRYPGSVKAELVERAKTAFARPEKADGHASSGSMTAQSPGSPARVSDYSGVLLTAELSGLAEEFGATQWWREHELVAVVQRWEGMLPRARATVADWRHVRGRQSPNADVRQLCILDAIEVAFDAFDDAGTALIPLLDPASVGNVGTQVSVARRAIRDLAAAVEDVENLRTEASADTLQSEELPFSAPTTVLTEAVTASDPVPRLSAAFQEVAPFIAAISDYVPRAVHLSEDSLAIVTRLVRAVGACAERALDQMTLAAVPIEHEAHWNSNARQLTADVGALLTELHIYRQVRRRQEWRDLAEPESSGQLDKRLRDLASARARLGRSLDRLSQHVGGGPELATR